MVKTEGLGSFDVGLFAGFFDFVDLFFGVAAGFGEENLDAFDAGGFDMLIAVVLVDLVNFGFKCIKGSLLLWQELLGT